MIQFVKQICTVLQQTKKENVFTKATSVSNDQTPSCILVVAAAA
jgi:hypothetical protein